MKTLSADIQLLDAEGQINRHGGANRSIFAIYVANTLKILLYFNIQMHE
jgi:hypothetical protein